MKRIIVALALSLGLTAVASAQTFYLERITLRFDDGTIVDSAADNTTVSGSLSIAGGVASRNETLCSSGVCDSFSQTVTLVEFRDNLSSVEVRDGEGSEFVLSILNHDPLILLEQVANGTIVERWVRNKAGTPQAKTTATDTQSTQSLLPTPVILEAMGLFRRE